MDSRNKRASALGIALAFLVVLPAPDASVDTPDRPHVAFSYAGITLSEAGYNPAASGGAALAVSDDLVTMLEVWDELRQELET